MTVVYIALGTNLEPREEHLEKALQLFQNNPDVQVKQVSSIYESTAVGYLDQPDFLNLVFEAETELSCSALLDACQSVENELGRIRTIRFGPRTLDADIILFGDAVIDEERVTVPHPRLQERTFVLLPMEELKPNLIVPKLDKTITDLIAALPAEEWAGIWNYRK